MTGLTESRGTCFGFEVLSPLDFRFLRPGYGELIKVTSHEELSSPAEAELVVEWKQRPGRPFYGRVYRDPAGCYHVWTSDAGWFSVDPADRLIRAEVKADDLRREVRLLTTPMLLLMVNRGDLPLHASAVEINGRAYLFGAPSRFGKTTMAAGFHAAGYRVLAEDVACVQIGDKPMVIPGPALLRLRRDVAEKLTLSSVRKQGEDPDRLFLALEDEARNGSGPLPLGGVVLLRGHSDRPTLEPIAGPDLLRDLWALGFKLPTDEDFQRCFDGLTRLSGAATIWNLSFPMDLDKLPATVETLVSAFDQ
jgi:hypothetical protein